MESINDALRLDESPVSSKLRLLKLLSISRFVLAIILIFLLGINASTAVQDNLGSNPAFIAVMYALSALAALCALQFSPINWRGQLFAQLSIDVALISLLVSSLGGSTGNFSILYLMPIAVAATLLNWTGALFICSLSVLFLLIDGGRRQFILNLEFDWFQLGVQGLISFFIMAALRYAAMRNEQAETLIRRERTQERLRKELQDQHIQEDSQGWMVVNASNVVQMMNAQARTLAWKARVFLEIGQTIESSDAVFVWLSAMPKTHEISVSWPPEAYRSELNSSKPEAQFDSLLFIKAQPLPHMVGLTALTLELSSDRSARLRNEQLATMGRLSASIAHEIRNPLAAISQAAELLNEASDIKDSDRPLLEMLVSNAQRIDRIVHNLLSWSRGTQASPVEINPQAALSRMVKHIGFGLGLPSDQLMIETSVELPQMVRFDEDHLYQILSNLISNAAKYASGKPNSIGLVLRPRGKFVALLVLDDGAEVDPAVVKNLFEPFQSASKGGTGLGLFLCREYAQASQGSLQLMTQTIGADKDTTWVKAPYTKAFVLNLPLAFPADA